LAVSACISSSQYVIRISLYIAAALARYCRAGSQSPQRRWSLERPTWQCASWARTPSSPASA